MRSGHLVRRIAIPVALSAVTLCSSLFAQEPTLEETVQYINSKLVGCESSWADARESVHAMLESTGSNKVKLSGHEWAVWRLRDGFVIGPRSVYVDGEIDFSMVSAEVESESYADRHILREELGFAGEVRARCSERFCMSKIRGNLDGSLSSDELDEWGRLEVRRFPNTRFMIGERGGFRLYVCRDVERVRKALAHLIKLSGGREELF